MNDFIKNMSVVLPSYKPDEKLLAVLEGLTQKGFRDVIVVNDGSGSGLWRRYLTSQHDNRSNSPGASPLPVEIKNPAAS